MARKTREAERRAMAANLTNFGVLRISAIAVDDDAVAVVVVLITGAVGFILFVFGNCPLFYFLMKLTESPAGKK